MRSQAFHGLEAYSGKGKLIYSLISQTRALESISGEFCTSDKLVGKIGVVVDAVHVTAVDGDVYSRVDRDGKRWFDPNENWGKAFFFDGEIQDKWSYDESDARFDDGLSNDCLRRCSDSASSQRRYAEFFAKEAVIVCVVVDAYAKAIDKKRARVLARALSVPCVETQGNFRMYQFD